MKSIAVIAIHFSKEPSDLTGPWHRCELVDSGDHETWQPPVDRLIDRHDGESAIVSTREFAIAIHANHPEVIWFIIVWNQAKRDVLEFGVTPRAIFQRNRRRLPVVILKRDRL